MKSDKLQDAIGMIDTDLVSRANPNKHKKTKIFRIRWIVPIAAVLAIVIAIGVFFPRGNNPVKPQNNAKPIPTKPVTPKDPYTLIKAEYKAEYPIMAQYGEETYFEWLEDKKKQRSFNGAGKNLDEFLQMTISEFLTDSNGSNKLYSPLNVYMALAITAEISDSDSRQQILDLLDADSIEDLRKQAHAIWNANYCDDGMTKSVLASSLWLADDIDYNEQTIQNVVKNYYASTFSGEFGSEEYNKAYRTWLNEQTGNLLKEQIDKKELSPDTIMTIATTLYLKAPWETFFSESRTTKSKFYSSNGTKTCDFMNDTILLDDYYWGDKFTAVSKSINGSGRMYFILPDEGVCAESLLKNDAETLDFIINHSEWNNKKAVKINLSVPKFDVNSQLDLVEKLKNLGITDCFDSSTADFSSLLSHNGTFISNILHGVRVSIDEEGVTGAAYTEVFLAAGAPMPDETVDFVVNRPFIFVITGVDDLPLFVGVVNQV